ncbi:TPA: hypothetical protein ACFP4Y_000303 [Neisseria bacilliformis]|uniref:hypothetical protein n=1 Tax=Neisseria bacilliformis TaxID=267212 RepID=UPI00178CD68A|nr:hypothetical protein [Neisseria bacilliformis]
MELKKANHGRRISGILSAVVIREEKESGKTRKIKDADSTTNKAADTLAHTGSPLLIGRINRGFQTASNGIEAV